MEGTSAEFDRVVLLGTTFPCCCQLAEVQLWQSLVSNTLRCVGLIIIIEFFPNSKLLVAEIMATFFLYEIGYATAMIAFGASYSDIHMSHKVTEC